MNFSLFCFVFFFAKKSIFFTALSLLTALAALTLVINDTTTFATYNTHVAIPALLTTRISQLHKRGTVLCIQSTKIEKCAFTTLVAKAAVYFREYRESYSFRLSVSPSYTFHFFNGQR